MSKVIVPLTDAQLRRSKPAAKTFKLFDGGGLYLEILPTGSKFWRLRYRGANGKANLLSFGPYPEVSLAEARERRAEERRLLRDGVDLVVHREMCRRKQVG